MADYIIDIETDGIDATKIHCMAVREESGHIQVHTVYDDMRSFLDSLRDSDRIIGHNFIRYDWPVLSRILKVETKAFIVDTLSLSWYLYPDVVKHGLEQWGERFGIAKPKIDDWENLDIGEYCRRCVEDVKINTMLWEKQSEYLSNLYNDANPDRVIRYLSLKMRCAALQEKSKWKLDVEKAKSLLSDLEQSYQESVDTLFAVMPEVKKIKKCKRPAKPYKIDGSLSVTGLRWKEITEEAGKDFDTKETIEVVVGTEQPNPGSVQQLKDWLKSLGWKAETFKFSKQTGKAVEQIKNNDGSLCKSVTKMFDKHPELAHLETMTVVKHRIGLVKGFLDNVDSDGYVMAQIQGFTNTLRFKHAVCVNIPSSRKPYGAEIRSLLTVRSPDNILCGSDMASLEDRTKQHYMWDHDPEYVKEMMTPDFDPHLDLALSAGVLTKQEVADYKAGFQPEDIVKIRHIYKGGNYACTYGAGVATLSRQLGISEEDAKTVREAYWKRNWSLETIADNVGIRRIEGDKMWLWNPVAKIYYYLKTEKDKFSTLNQGTGTFCFDMWLAYIIQERPQLTAQFHDEVILEINETKQNDIKELLNKSIQKVNKLLHLNRELECDIKFAKDYSEIH